MELLKKDFAGDMRLLDLNYDLIRLFCQKNPEEERGIEQRVFESERVWVDV